MKILNIYTYIILLASLIISLIYISAYSGPNRATYINIYSGIINNSSIFSENSIDNYIKDKLTAECKLYKFKNLNIKHKKNSINIIVEYDNNNNDDLSNLTKAYDCIKSNINTKYQNLLDLNNKEIKNLEDTLLKFENIIKHNNSNFPEKYQLIKDIQILKSKMNMMNAADIRMENYRPNFELITVETNNFFKRIMHSITLTLTILIYVFYNKSIKAYYHKLFLS